MRGEYGLAIHDLPPMQVALLAVNLPDGSLVWQELNTARAWTFDQYLAVLRIEQMNLWMWANTDPKTVARDHVRCHGRGSPKSSRRLLPSRTTRAGARCGERAPSKRWA